MNNDRKQLIRIAAKRPVGDPVRRVLLAELQKTAKTAKTAGGLIWNLLDQRAFMKVYNELSKDDEQAADLLYEVLTTLQDKLDISERESQALGRLEGLIKAGSRWKPALQRNNIFKAADLLGINLPSGMF